MEGRRDQGRVDGFQQALSGPGIPTPNCPSGCPRTWLATQFPEEAFVLLWRKNKRPQRIHFSAVPQLAWKGDNDEVKNLAILLI